MPSEYHDANQLPATLVTQATPFLYQSPGVLCSSGGTNLSTGSPGSAYIASAVTNLEATLNGANLGTQTNPGVPPSAIGGGLTKVTYAQAEAGVFAPVNGPVRS